MPEGLPLGCGFTILLATPCAERNSGAPPSSGSAARRVSLIVSISHWRSLTLASVFGKVCKSVPKRGRNRVRPPPGGRFVLGCCWLRAVSRAWWSSPRLRSVMLLQRAQLWLKYFHSGLIWRGIRFNFLMVTGTHGLQAD